MPTPEAHAREQIDAMLVACGWVLQKFSALNLGIGRGIALREVPLNSGRCDYLLLVDRKPVGVIEAKRFAANCSSKPTSTPSAPAHGHLLCARREGKRPFP
jgi:type I restriction enzyme R subunit